MPITYQRLGNSGGGGMVVEISAYPNTQISLSNEKNTYTKTTDGTGKAIFKGLKAGTYTAMCTVNTKQFTTQITIVDTIKTGLPSAQIKQLPLKAKIKLSNGIKMILMNKNLSGHPTNSATFVSEYIVEDYPYGSYGTYEYSKTNIHLKLLPKYYNKMSADEKKSIIKRKFKTKWYWRDFDYNDQSGRYDDAEITTDFYLLSDNEINSKNSFNDGVNVGFTNDASRIKKYENGSVGTWYIRNAVWDTSSGYASDEHAVQYYVNELGKLTSKDARSGGDNVVMEGIVPCCDISQDAYVALDSDGYYRILGM